MPLDPELSFVRLPLSPQWPERRTKLDSLTPTMPLKMFRKATRETLFLLTVGLGLPGGTSQAARVLPL